MDMYTIKDTVTDSTVAVVDGKQMSLEEAFEALRDELKDMQKQRDDAVECVEMFIKSYKCCALCANNECKMKEKHDDSCSPIWNGLEW